MGRLDKLRRRRAAAVALVGLLVAIVIAMTLGIYASRTRYTPMGAKALYAALSKDQYSLDGRPIAVTGNVYSVDRSRGLVAIAVHAVGNHWVWVSLEGLNRVRPSVGARVTVSGRAWFYHSNRNFFLGMDGTDANIKIVNGAHGPTH